MRRTWGGRAVDWTIVAVLVACGEDPSGIVDDVALTAEVVVTGLSDPTVLTSPLGDDRAFVAEQGGRILIVEADSLVTSPFLDLSGIVLSGGERGLLGLAFHPMYASNGYFYVNYTDQAGDTRVVRYTRSSDPYVADAASASVILTVGQPFPNHNGGALAFGPAGHLFIALGDGGSGGDPDGNGQDSTTLLGSILRIDVDGASPYAIPSNNPFAGHPTARPEIWAYGLRNPWRFSIDAADDMLYIGDVGQSTWEEVDAVPRATSTAYNFGWNTVEGLECFQGGSCDLSAFTAPVIAYPTNTGCAIVGGFVYRGLAIPDLRGTYFYGDHCTGVIRSLRVTNGNADEHRQWSLGTSGSLLSFGEDADGELYVLSSDGIVYRIVSAS